VAGEYAVVPAKVSDRHGDHASYSVYCGDVRLAYGLSCCGAKDRAEARTAAKARAEAEEFMARMREHPLEFEEGSIFHTKEEA
jgi:hypothetical protein